MLQNEIITKLPVVSITLITNVLQGETKMRKKEMENDNADTRRHVMENNNAITCKQKEQKESTLELVPPHLHNSHAK